MLSCQPNLCLGLTFIWGAWQGLINCAQSCALSSTNLPCGARPERRLPPVAARIPGRLAWAESSSMGQEVLWELKEGSAWFSLVSAATLHLITNFSTLSFLVDGWGKAAFADDIGLSIIFFLGIQNVLMTESSLLIYYIRNKAYCSGFWAGQN